MFPRPKNTDTMEDVTNMLKDYLEEKNESDFKPAARVVPDASHPMISVFAQLRNLSASKAIAGDNAKNPVGNQSENQTESQAEELNDNQARNLVENRAEETVENKSEEINMMVGSSDVIGDVVERRYKEESVMESDNSEAGTSSSDEGFPKPIPIDVKPEFGETKGQGKSIFSKMIQSGIQLQKDEPASKLKSESKKTDQCKKTFGSAKAISNPFFKEVFPTAMSGMSEREILEEQTTLLKKMDPKLVEFVRSKRKSSDQDNPSGSPKGSQPKSQKTKTEIKDSLPVLDFLENEQAQNWVHFDILEPEKLEWTKNLEKTFAKLKPGQTYEARFNWEGFLQPYIDSSSTTRDDRELYLHGEDQNRPGYTLQEFFRLARANVLQQRVAAINAIAGIIKIYNQGYYDGILELPISKIFFFLRLAMDEKLLAVVEAATRALAYLFYNETDETLIDFTFETRNGIIQPVMDNKAASIAGSGLGSCQDDLDEDLETSLKNLSLNGKRNMFESTIEDYDEEDQGMEDFNDYHLAEVNLIECLMRTNIINRITYILTSMNPSDIGIHSCVKILIRIARTGRHHAFKILTKSNLIEYMIKEFLPPIESYKEPHLNVLKLFRIIASFDRSFCLKLRELGVMELAVGYISTRNVVSVKLMKLQIESFRFLRLFFSLFPSVIKFKELFNPLVNLLTWHYQHLEFEKENHFLIRQHVSGLLHLLNCGDLVSVFPIFSELLKMCCCKWFTMATRYGVNDFSQKLLLTTLLEVSGPFVGFSAEYFFDFINNYLIKFLRTAHYDQFVKSLITSSPLFIHNGFDRCSIYKPLVNLGSIVRRYKKSSPSLVLSQEYSVHFLDALRMFIDKLHNMSHTMNQDIHRKLCEIFFNEDVEKYLEGFSVQYNRGLSTNWFLKTEINFLFELLNSPSLQFNPCRLKAAFNLLNCLTEDNLEKIFHIFKNFVFNDRHYYDNNIKKEEYERWNQIYNGAVIMNLKVDPFKIVSFASNWNQIMLNEAWPFSLLLVLLYRAEIDESKKRIIETDLSEEEIISTVLKFSLVLEKNEVNLINSNQQLMYLMLVYFGKDLNFLDAPIKKLIKEKLKRLKGASFPKRFNMKLNKEKSFESLYTMFLDTFQSSSYCDDMFSVLVMIPLAQKYDVKWRKLVWSEYVSSMTFIGCKETDLFDEINEYLYPIETDQSLLKCYATALATNLLRKNSLPWKIAMHHYKHAKESFN